MWGCFQKWHFLKTFVTCRHTIFFLSNRKYTYLLIQSFNNFITISYIFSTPKICFDLEFHCYFVVFSMTSLLTHTVAHSTTLSFRPKTNNQPIKTFGLEFAKLFLDSLFLASVPWKHSKIHQNKIFSQQVRAIMVTKYHSHFLTCDFFCQHCSSVFSKNSKLHGSLSRFPCCQWSKSKAANFVIFIRSLGQKQTLHSGYSEYISTHCALPTCNPDNLCIPH